MSLQFKPKYCYKYPKCKFYTFCVTDMGQGYDVLKCEMRFACLNYSKKCDAILNGKGKHSGRIKIS